MFLYPGWHWLFRLDHTIWHWLCLLAWSIQLLLALIRVIACANHETCSQIVLFSLSFYNYKSLEKAVAPNVALTPLPLGKVGPMSPSVPSTSHPSGGEPPGEGANSRPRKRRATGELPAPEAPCPLFSAASKPLLPPQEDKDSEVEIEVESRDECKLKGSINARNSMCVVVMGLASKILTDLTESTQFQPLKSICKFHLQNISAFFLASPNSHFVHVLPVIAILHFIQQLSQGPELARCPTAHLPCHIR